MNTEGLAEFHREMMVFDMHSDIPCEIIRRRSLGETEVLNNVFLDPMMKGGVDSCQSILLSLQAVFGPFGRGTQLH